MKIYVVDKYNELKFILKDFYRNEEINIEKKENFNFRMTKNDFLITTDKDVCNELEKQKNIIMIVFEKDYKHIWKLTQNYKTIDLIDVNMDADYIVKRIERGMEKVN